MDPKDTAHPGGREAVRADRPLQNTYWIETGRLLAGEHPGATRTEDAESRIRRVLNAGLDYFIDLTEEYELPEYESLLVALHPDARYRRFAIEDHGLPADPAVVVAALDCIDEALAAGHNVYLHCRAGVGRTGTVLGCYLVRHGAQNEDALDRLADLWQQSERSQRIPQIPETEAQASYVRFWHEPVVAAHLHARGTLSDRVQGALFGLALGEAAAAGQGIKWGPHAAMTLLLAASLTEQGGNDPDDQLRRYQRWRKDGRIPGSSLPVEPPPMVNRAVATWQWSRKSFAGPHDPANLDPHTLARTTAVALCLRSRPELALEAATDASRTTLQSPVVLDCCRYFAALLLEAAAGATKPKIFALSRTGQLLDVRALKPDVDSMRRTSWQTASAPAKALTATTTLAAALVAFAQSADFDAGLMVAQRTIGDAATVAALYGALAGAHYGLRALPADATGRLADASLIESVARALAAAPGAA